MSEQNNNGRFKRIWSDLSETPKSLWLFSFIVLLSGIGLMVSAKIPSPLGWTADEPAELARDIGIALIVAPVVTIIYEAGTRRSAKFKEMSDLLNLTMRSFVTDDIWQEIKEQIVRRNRTRRNIEIKVRVLREVQVDDTKKILPENVIVLEIEYGYDLHRLTAEGQKVEISHALDIHMRDEAFQIPCFKWVDVTIEDRLHRYEKEELAKSYDRATGLLSYNIHLPEAGSARIVSNRYEKIFVPGMYTLFMPEIITHAEGVKPDSRTIHLTVEDLPADLEAKATTWFAPHELVPETANEWSFKRPMLPGQGIGLIFTKRIPLLTPAPVVASASGTKAEAGSRAQDELAPTTEPT